MEALFKPYKITKAQLNSIPIANGQIIFVYDEKEIYIDQNSERILAMSDTTYDVATKLTDGLMSADDKKKLSNMGTGGGGTYVDMYVENGTLFVTLEQGSQKIIIEVSVIDNEILNITSTSENVKIVEENNEGILLFAIDDIDTNLSMSIVYNSILNIQTENS